MPIDGERTRASIVLGDKRTSWHREIRDGKTSIKGREINHLYSRMPDRGGFPIQHFGFHGPRRSTGFSGHAKTPVPRLAAGAPG